MIPTRNATTKPGGGWRRATLATILIVLSLNAIAAGIGFVGAPDGSALGIPQAWLEGSPFADYLVPGALLLALGILYGYAAIRELLRRRDAWFWAGLSGGAMIVWILVQVAYMDYDRHPVQTLLQAVVLTSGVLVGAIAFSQMRATRGASRGARP